MSDAAAADEEAVDVLIAGGGPVGTALAIELGTRGVSCLVVERRTTRTAQPKAKLTNIRTMTLLRRWGFADAVRRAAPLPPEFPSDIAFVTRLTGWELHRFPNALSTALDRSRPYPEPAQQIPQGVLEDVLREQAERLPSVQWQRGMELERFEQSSDSVRAELTDVESGRRRRVRARYLAGCDGAHSLVRGQLGIEMEQSGSVAHNLSAVFRAPTLWSLHDKPPAVHYWIINSEVPSMMGPLDATEQWWFYVHEVHGDKQVSADEARKLFFAAVGEEFPCEVLAHGPWVAQCMVADRYRSGRAFLLGDAAHLHPPLGGYGMNMGIGDAVDLGWKLAAVLGGWGGAALLDSYEIERRPIHLRVIEEAAQNYTRNAAQLLDPDLELQSPAGEQSRARSAEVIRVEKAREFASIGVQLGYRYEDSPIIVPDGSDPTPDEVSSYEPTARPGHLAPHAWIDGEHCLYDLFGRDMTLLCFGGVDASTLLDAAGAIDMPVHVVDLPRSELRELYQADLVLIRPDQHVGWRGNEVTDPTMIIDRVRAADRRAHSDSSEPTRVGSN